MQPSGFKSLRLGIVLLLALSVGGLSLGAQTGAQRVAAATAPAIGLACTYGPTFTVDAKTGIITISDGNTVFMWSYSVGGQPFQYPGPVLCVNQGDTVTVIFHNTLSEDSSIIFPGQTNVLANGAPAQPQFDGTGKATSLTNVAPANGGSMTYSFVASNPGTYLYQSGTNPEKQARMGLSGALIVRPTSGANFAYNRADSRFTPEEEFLVFLTEIDPYQHSAAEQNLPFDLTTYHVHYWLLNGRTFPDTIADNFATRLPSQPYGSLARIHPYDATAHPYPGLARYINAGSEEYSHHPHGHNGVVIGRDGQPVAGPAGQDMSFEKYAINIGPGADLGCSHAVV